MGEFGVYVFEFTVPSYMFERTSGKIREGEEGFKGKRKHVKKSDGSYELQPETDEGI
jgi:hypothetical protein